MGIDLTLLPFDCDHDNLSFSHTVLQLPRDYGLYDRIRGIPKTKIPDGFHSYVSRDGEYEEPHYGTTTTDSYGDEIECATAGGLKTVGIEGPTGAYINALPDDCRVAIFYH